jgi:hypothetical protein
MTAASGLTLAEARADSEGWGRLAESATLLVGTGGIAIEEFLNRPVEHWVGGVAGAMRQVVVPELVVSSGMLRRARSGETAADVDGEEQVGHVVSARRLGVEVVRGRS